MHILESSHRSCTDGRRTYAAARLGPRGHFTTDSVDAFILVANSSGGHHKASRVSATRRSLYSIHTLDNCTRSSVPCGRESGLSAFLGAAGHKASVELSSGTPNAFDKDRASTKVFRLLDGIVRLYYLCSHAHFLKVRTVRPKVEGRQEIPATHARRQYLWWSMKDADAHA